MKGILQSYPPLGQVTPVQHHEIQITSVLNLETSKNHGQDPWEVVLWISIDRGDWKTKELRLIESHDESSLLPYQPHSTFLYFHCSIHIEESAQFTLKFRGATDASWIWARDEEGLDDGIIVVASPISSSKDLYSYIPDLNMEWEASYRVSQSPGTQLWSLQCSIPGSSGADSAFKAIKIGRPWGSYLRWFALVRQRPAWIGPRQGKSDFNVDQDAILCCFLSHTGRTIAVLAVSGVDAVSTILRHTTQSGISASARNDSESLGTIRVLVSEGIDFDHAVAAVMYHARSLLSHDYDVINNPADTTQNEGSLATRTWQASWHDGLGFCTWNALGQQLSESRVLEAVEKLSQLKVRISTFIIDDNWQSLDHYGSDQSQRGWAEFEADREAFPNGMQELVAQIRHRYPDIQKILVWHALFGYWGGISPDGAIAKAYRTVQVVQDDERQSHLTIIAKEDISRFYDDFYKFLRNSGINGVKADAQVMMDALKTAPDRRNLMSAYLDAWAAASQKYFGDTTISCMSQFPHSLFYSLLPRSRRQILVRNSDDFFPDVPESHPWHVWANAHNAILAQFLNALPDWDMFQTPHDYSGFHAAARCVSGGPIYITDVPGNHSLQILKQMTADTPLGQTIVLRPSNIGRSMYPYSGYEDNFLLKIGTYNGPSQTGTSILGIFNISSRHLVELIPLACFPGTFPSRKYVVRAHTTGKISSPFYIGTSESLITTSVETGGYEIMCAFPVTAFEGTLMGRLGRGYAAILGLTKKMTGCAALTTSSIVQRENGRVVASCSMKALGTLGIYISTLPDMDLANEFMAAIEDIPVPLESVRRSEDDSRVLDIDLSTAWEFMQLDDFQRSEIRVELIFSV